VAPRKINGETKNKVEEIFNNVWIYYDEDSGYISMYDYK